MNFNKQYSNYKYEVYCTLFRCYQLDIHVQICYIDFVVFCNRKPVSDVDYELSYKRGDVEELVPPSRLDWQRSLGSAGKTLHSRAPQVKPADEEDVSIYPVDSETHDMSHPWGRPVKPCTPRHHR